MPNAAVRAELSGIMRERARFAACIAVLIPGSGFWASALRSMVVALAMLRPRDMQLSILSEAAELAQRVAPLHQARTGVQLEAAELLAAIQQAERAAGASRAHAAA